MRGSPLFSSVLNQHIFEVTIPEHWVGKTIGELDIRKKYKINIMGLKSNGKIDLSIHSDTMLEKEKTMLVLGDYKNIHKCFHI